ncbi:MAG: M14 family zinc carboxypeptidase [Pseudomonadota bacterium]
MSTSLLLWLAVGCGPGGAERAPLAEAWIGPGQGSTADLAATLAAAPLSTDGPGAAGRWRVIAADATLDALAVRGLEVTGRRADHRVDPDRMPDYHDPEELVAALEGLAAGCQEPCEIVEYGQSVEGRPLVALRLGEGPVALRLLGAHHGDEPVSSEVALDIATRLAASGVPGGFEIWIAPQVNPDGIAAGSRYNARDVDLNRNYDLEWSAWEFRAGDAPFSEPEGRAVRVMADYTPFLGGLSLHGGAELICYVWNYTTVDSPDEAPLLSQAQAYREACDQAGFSVINGGAWYITHGDSTDWSYGRHGTFDHTVEVSSDKAPPVGALAAVAEDHAPALLDFLSQAPDVTGIVRDAVDGGALEATLTTATGSVVVAGPEGRFAHWLPAGEATFSVTLPGYRAATVAVPRAEGQPSSVEIALEREALLAALPEPRLLAWGATERSFTLPGCEAEALTLWRPGYASVAVRGGGGAFTVRTDSLEPGPWGIDADCGARPHALFVGERSDRVAIAVAEVVRGALVLEGQGFGPGSRAWAVAGASRALIPLTLQAEDEGRLTFDPAPLAGLDEPIDLLVLSSGAQLTVLDLLGAASIDTAAPRDSGLVDSDTGLHPRIVPGGRACGCAASPPGGLARLTVLVSLAAVCFTARRRNPRRARVSDPLRPTVGLALAQPGGATPERDRPPRGSHHGR